MVIPDNETRNKHKINNVCNRSTWTDSRQHVFNHERYSINVQLCITTAVIARKCHHKKHIRIYKLLQKQCWSCILLTNLTYTSWLLLNLKFQFYHIYSNSIYRNVWMVQHCHYKDNMQQTNITNKESLQYAGRNNPTK